MKILLTSILTLVVSIAISQSHQDEKKMVIDAAKYSAIHVYNHKGFVKVRGTNNETGQILVKRKLKARTNKKIQEAISLVYIDTLVLDNILIVYMQSPYHTLEGDINDDYLHYHSVQKWHNNRGRKGIEYSFDLDIGLPSSTNIVVTNHHGYIKVQDVSGELMADAHHKNIDLDRVSDVRYVHTHHGDIDISLDRVPSGDMSLGSHHGDIKVSVPGVPSAQVTFDSHHGNFYTDFDWETVFDESTTSKKTKHKTKYKLGENTAVQIGAGAHNISYSTHHGDMFLVQL